MPNRRTFELIIVSGMLLRPVFGSARLWSVKTMAATSPGSFMHTFAEVVSILT
jgi:hypothetical protein